LLKEVTPDFIPPSLWPPNSPDLNLVDYAIWGIMQERAYNKGKIANVEELRQRIVDEWERLDQRIIDGAVKEWRKRLLKEDSLNMSVIYSWQQQKCF